MLFLDGIVLGGLNSMYLQNPRVAPKDYSDFVIYCYCWYQLLQSFPPHKKASKITQYRQSQGR